MMPETKTMDCPVCAVAKAFIRCGHVRIDGQYFHLYHCPTCYVVIVRH